jgi:hypothetical protein
MRIAYVPDSGAERRSGWRTEDTDSVETHTQRACRLSGLVIAGLVVFCLGSAHLPSIEVSVPEEPGDCVLNLAGVVSCYAEAAGGDLGRSSDPGLGSSSRDKNGLPYHNGANLICSDCHVMHASMGHNYDGGFGPEGGVPSFPWIFQPTPKLLKAPDPLDVCLACHDGQSGVPDVLSADANGLNERSAGFFHDPETSNPRGHDLGRDLEMGHGGQICNRCHAGNPQHRRVTCIDCHAHHGNGNTRNLQWVSEPDDTPPMGLFTAPGVSGLAKYERSNTAYGTLSSLELREPSSLCVHCHHTLTGEEYNDPDGDDIHSRHPSFDSERADPNSIDQGLARESTDPTHWEGGTGSGFDGADRVPFVVHGAADYVTASQVDASTNGVFCLSCHKAHGSGSAFGMVWELDGPPSRPGCDQCHAIKPLP